MLTARSERHVSREAAVIRSGNGTLHGRACIIFETMLQHFLSMQAKNANHGRDARKRRESLLLCFVRCPWDDVGGVL